MTFWIYKNIGTASLFELTEEGCIVVDVRDISDVEKDVDKVLEKIYIIAGLALHGRKVVVRCIAGMNRSNVLACGALCLIGNKDTVEETWNHQWKKVKEKVPRALPTMELIDTVKKALQKTKTFK